jgi:GAF domain-containing protein
VPIDATALEQTLRALRTQIAERDPCVTLQNTVHAASVIFSLSGAGLMLRDQYGVLRYVIASDESSRILEIVQEDLGDGPCIDCVIHDRIVASDDLATDTRWPSIGPKTEGAVRATLAVPVRLANVPVGSLNVHMERPRYWTDTDRRAIAAYAAVISDALAATMIVQQHSELADELQYALDHRIVIERAAGMLMGRLTINDVTAFEALRRTARNTRAPIAEVARHVLRGGALRH